MNNISKIDNKHITKTYIKIFSNKNSINSNDSQKETSYYNFGPIYGYERNKELKNQTISGINKFRTLNACNNLQNWPDKPKRARIDVNWFIFKPLLSASWLKV